MRKILFFCVCILAIASIFSHDINAFDDDQASNPTRFFGRPNADSGPTKVSMAIWVLDIDSIDSAAQNFTANFFMSAVWKDPRLAHKGNEPRILSLNDVWNPQLQIANEIGLVRKTLPSIVEVTPDGTVYYRQRIVGPFSQPLKLNDFPFDKHVFSLHIVSPVNDMKSIEFVPNEEWIKRGLSSASGIADNISLPDWIIEKSSAGPKPYLLTKGNQSPGYAFEFTAARDVRYYVFKVILPLVLIVMMSWTVFWIDPENAGTQIGVAATSMLTLIAYRFAVDTQVPKVPYTTRLDEFIFLSTVIVFMSLVQVNITAALVHKKRKALAQKIDSISRILFPSAFIIAVFYSLLA